LFLQAVAVAVGIKVLVVVLADIAQTQKPFS
jgi:hypothetical protein